MKKDITEKIGEHKEWYKQAHDEEMSLEKLPEFLRHLTEDYNHDYGTICHALTAGAIATMWAMNRTPQGGITGFQASCIMWEFIKNWMSYEGGMKLVKYDELLYPQYEYHFDKTISKSTWERIQQKAKEGISEGRACPEVIAHWKSIIDGKIPFGFVIKDDE